MNKKNKKQFNLLMLLPYLVVISMLMMFLSSGGHNTRKIPYNEFKKEATEMKFNNVDMEMDGLVINVSGTYTNKKKQKVQFDTTLPRTESNIKWLEKTLDRNGKNKITVDLPDDNTFWLNILFTLLPVLALAGLMWLSMKQMGGNGPGKSFDFIKSKAKIETSVKTRFTDVAGCKEEKAEVKELIDYLKNPKKYTDMGAKIPKGVLLVGPPGTGKTLLAKAVAGESNVPFFSASGSDFVEMFVGAGASRVRDMFKKAKQVAPCVIFIDEIDAVGRKRSGGNGMGGGNDEREQTLNQILVEMDGMGDNTGIVVIAATNRVDVLDPALLRSGRFDRKVAVSLPDIKERTAILEVHAKNKKLAPDVELENIARRTPTFSGADLANLLNEAAILAVRENRKVIEMNDLDEAIDRVMMGPAKTTRKYTEREKRLVAFHEAGHAVIGIKLEAADTVQKVTIIPRGDAGGYNLMTPEEEKFLSSKGELMAQIIGLLGGRTAEELIFGEISTGASNDIEKASNIARHMVKTFGMSSLGPIKFGDSQGNLFLGDGYSEGSYSAQIAYEIDKEIRNIIDQCHAKCREILEENNDLLHLIAESLITEETLTKEQIDNLTMYGQLENPETNTNEESTDDNSDEIAEVNE